MPRAVIFDQFGGPEVLRIGEIAAAAPRDGEVRIRVRALGLNRAEALMRRGQYIEHPTLPARLGLEAAGIVDAIGPGVSGLAVGDAVGVIPPISMIAHPTHGELAALPARHVVKNPAGLDWESAAALWMAYLTAYGALVEVAQIKAGDFVVVTAASSSVGIAAIQIANMVGARPIAVTRTSAKRAALVAAGAAHVVAFEEEAVAERLIAIVGSTGVRATLDAVGGPIVEALAAAMAPNGIVIEYGGLGAQPTPFPMPAALAKRLTLRGYLVHEVIEDNHRLDAAKAFILGGLATGALKPVIDRVFAFGDIAEAYRHLESNAQFGKVVVTV
ncbi:zinc-dependent alcohol dehydrogenase family protein [Sphingopyxis kveilinensis]|uniref:zinc-dependent alcohol dehydrogenase family protein n=1 Tax=Sphingopyxis kveilinensis TaxID=3114367 RepID=UPI0030CE05FA